MNFSLDSFKVNKCRSRSKKQLFLFNTISINSRTKYFKDVCLTFKRKQDIRTLLVITSELFSFLKSTESGPYWWKSTESSKIDFIVLIKSRIIQPLFATNRIKIGPLEPEIQPAKGTRRHYAGAYDVTCRHRPSASNNITCNTLQ